MKTSYLVAGVVAAVVAAASLVSAAGRGTQVTEVGTNYKYNFQEDLYTETFTGTTGLSNGPFSGGAEAEHHTQLQKVK